MIVLINIKKTCMKYHSSINDYKQEDCKINIVKRGTFNVVILAGKYVLVFMCL